VKKVYANFMRFLAF